MYSIKTRLLAAITIALTLATLCAAAAIYFSVENEINRLLDNSLRQVALAYQNVRSQDILRIRRDFFAQDESMVVQIIDPNTGAKALSRSMDPLPIADQIGFSNVKIGGEIWRLYTTQNSYGPIIEVAQPTFVRSEIALQSAKSVLLPLFFMLVLIALVCQIIIGQGFRALSRTASAIGRRSPSSLTPLSLKGLPAEIEPLVSSLNNLLEQLSDSLKAQKRFASDAAHELRTPLTALTLQIQLAERAKTEEARQKAFGRLKDGIKRATRLVTQLLTMARLDPDNRSQPLLPLDLTALAHSVCDELAPLAAQKNIELKAASDKPAVAIANEDALRLLMNNLCDNAMRYTPADGHIEIRTYIRASKAFIEVCDDGPGVPETERERIFERFYRAEGTKTIPGTGLGLAIVRRVAELHGGTPSLDAGLNGKGVCFRISFPVAGAQEEN
ncbi:ATP-binding protein [Parasutterella muris]|jgi:Signal transduction histidine kinase|uniref:histidine kinase n=2 Tax=Parasutterella TaxID=577310 RepID=A0A6L6YK66_9BURK|nr:ATP-binding protein [Parasutterella muris]MVX57804.1 histidine kinase [Parasutterella muris]